MSSVVIVAAKTCDFIPVLSLGSNIYALFKRRAYNKAITAGATDIANTPYYTYLKNKPAKRCLLLMIPGFNIFFAIYFATKGSKTASAPVDPTNPSGITTQPPPATTSPVKKSDPSTQSRVSTKIEESLAASVAAAKQQAPKKPPQTPQPRPMPAPAVPPVITPTTAPVSANTGILMTAVLAGNFELFLDESQMAQGSITGFVKNAGHWFKCSATQSVDLASFAVFFDFANSLNPVKPSMVVQSNNCVILSQVSFNSIANGLAHKKFGIKEQDMTPLINGMMAQRVAF
jgi:hypothetical protein